MTVVVAFYCSDGVVVASDSMLTPSMGQIATGHNTGRKVHVLSNTQIFAFAGDHGQAERFRIVVNGQNPIDHITEHAINYPLAISANLVQQYTSTGIGDSINLNIILAFNCKYGHQ